MPLCELLLTPKSCIATSNTYSLKLIKYETASKKFKSRTLPEGAETYIKPQFSISLLLD